MLSNPLNNGRDMDVSFQNYYSSNNNSLIHLMLLKEMFVKKYFVDVKKFCRFITYTRVLHHIGVNSGGCAMIPDGTTLPCS